MICSARALSVVLALGIAAPVLAVVPVTITGIAFFKGRKLFRDPQTPGESG